jgi:hypothetical protein
LDGLVAGDNLHHYASQIPKSLLDLNALHVSEDRKPDLAGGTSRGGVDDAMTAELVAEGAARSIPEQKQGRRGKGWVGRGGPRMTIGEVSRGVGVVAAR